MLPPSSLQLFFVALSFVQLYHKMSSSFCITVEKKIVYYIQEDNVL